MDTITRHGYTSSDLHVAQQLRRDKLRGGGSSYSEDFPADVLFNTGGSYSSIHPTRFVLPSGGLSDNWGDLASYQQGLSLSLSSSQICEIRRLGLLKESGNAGPFGPFTGYTTVLKGSKYLNPAQMLLDEFVCGVGLKMTTMEDSISSSSSADCSEGQLRGGVRNGYGGGGDESYRADCHENKAKLINMQEEVCKRQKQYDQEIQMVMSAFESIPGIAIATPYILLALKTLSRHFKRLKNAIANQLRYIKNNMGEDLPSTEASISRGLRFDQNFTKVKSSGSGASGYQSHIWRPQRGLPERAVCILRAWLFDHFLHPYPTDVDKQMLATQTGLSRNQVSNWFINARVRLWKPMVEEIHMLDSKSTSKNNTHEPNSNNNGNQPGFQPWHLESLGRTSNSYMQMQGSSSTMGMKETSNHPQITTLGVESFVGFLPNYERQGLERGGIGIGAAVSLTLGLRHGSETMHSFQQQGMHFGAHIYDPGNGV